MSDFSLKDWVDLVFKFLAVLVALFGVWKFYADRAHSIVLDSRKESLDTIERYSSYNVMSARETLTSFWTRHSDFAGFLGSGHSITAREYKGFVSRAITNDTKKDEIFDALFQLNDYYQSALYCRESTVCDKRLLDGFLCEKAVPHFEIYEDFYHYLNAWIGGDEFGNSLELIYLSCISGD